MQVFAIRHGETAWSPSRQHTGTTDIPWSPRARTVGPSCKPPSWTSHSTPWSTATRSAQHLAGKPAPDTFLTAAKLLGTEPNRAVVIEDAISRVQAGSNGGFGLVIGVARKGNADELRRNGARLVVSDLGELVDSTQPTMRGNRPDAPS